MLNSKYNSFGHWLLFVQQSMLQTVLQQYDLFIKTWYFLLQIDSSLWHVVWIHTPSTIYFVKKLWLTLTIHGIIGCMWTESYRVHVTLLIVDVLWLYFSDSYKIYVALCVDECRAFVYTFLSALLVLLTVIVILLVFN